MTAAVQQLQDRLARQAEVDHKVLVVICHLEETNVTVIEAQTQLDPIVVSASLTRLTDDGTLTRRLSDGKMLWKVDA